MKKWLEFSKIVVYLMWIITVIWVTASYFLAWKGKDTNSPVTITVITTLLGVLIAYFITKTTEKVSRNKHGLDANGNKIIDSTITSQEGEQK